MPPYRYLTEFRPLAVKHPMLSFLFPSSKQITSALGAVKAANIGLSESSRNCSSLSLDEEEKPPVLCLVRAMGAILALPSWQLSKSDGPLWPSIPTWMPNGKNLESCYLMDADSWAFGEA